MEDLNIMDRLQKKESEMTFHERVLAIMAHYKEAEKMLQSLSYDIGQLCPMSHYPTATVPFNAQVIEILLLAQSSQKKLETLSQSHTMFSDLDETKKKRLKEIADQIEVHGD